MEEIKGEYFQSENDNQTQYLVHFNIVQQGVNVEVIIYEFDRHSMEAVNGQVIECHPVHLKKFCEINVWPKYYFPTFNQERYQFYHDYDKNGTEDAIKGMHDVMQYALRRALEIGEITLY